VTPPDHTGASPRSSPRLSGRQRPLLIAGDSVPRSLRLIEVDRAFGHASARVGLWAELTSACRQGAAPGAVVGAGPGDGAVRHVPQLTGEGYALPHRHAVAQPQPVGREPGVATGDHCSHR